MATVDFGAEVLFEELVVVGAVRGDGEVDVVVGTGDGADEVVEVVSLGVGVVVVVSVVALVAGPVVVAGSVVEVVPLVVSAVVGSVVGSVAEAGPRPVRSRAHTRAGTVASLAQLPALPPSDNVPSFRRQRAALAVAPPGRAPGTP